MAHGEGDGDEATTRSSGPHGETSTLIGVVFDAGAIDDLMDERTRATVAYVARHEKLRLVAPATAVTEFLIGHPRDQVRAERALNVLVELAVTPAVGRRAAWLLRRARRPARSGPGVADGIVAAFAEGHGAVATHDIEDLAALAAAGTGFDVYSVPELMRTLGPGR